MLKRAQPILIFTLLFATVGLLGYAQIWAIPPCEEVRIFDNRIKVVFKPGCKEVDNVYFWKGYSSDPDNDPNYDSNCTGDCSPTSCSDCPNSDCDSCWREAMKTTAMMCTCEGSECVDDLNGGINENITRQEVGRYDVTVVCYPVKDTGPLSGCPVYLNPDRYFFGGGYYR